MKPCTCTEHHESRRIVLTGGPGAGKTAVLELVRQSLCIHMQILPEAAGIVFGGGFPRHDRVEVRRAGQRAIFHVQRELEAATSGENAAVILCDRGTVDGEAYWPGPESLWEAVGSTREDELQRYAAVIHLRTPPAEGGYNHVNPLRLETAAEALRIDERIALAWAGHPRQYEVPPSADFMSKAQTAIEILRTELSPCCREHFAARA